MGESRQGRSRENCRLTFDIACRTTCVGAGMPGACSTSGTCPSQRGRPSWSVWHQVNTLHHISNGEPSEGALGMIVLAAQLSCGTEASCQQVQLSCPGDWHVLHRRDSTGSNGSNGEGISLLRIGSITLPSSMDLRQYLEQMQASTSCPCTIPICWSTMENQASCCVPSVAAHVHRQGPC